LQPAARLTPRERDANQEEDTDLPSGLRFRPAVVARRQMAPHRPATRVTCRPVQEVDDRLRSSVQSTPKTEARSSIEHPLAWSRVWATPPTRQDSSLGVGRSIVSPAVHTDSAFRGQTPDEMYFRTGDAVPADLTARAAAARRARVEANRAAACGTCPSTEAAA